MRRAFLWIYLAGAVLVTIGVLLQAFSITAYVRGAGSGALDMHETVGFITHDIEILTFLAALVGLWGAWGRIGLALALPVIGTIQVFAIGDTDTSGGWANGLHGLLAMVVLILAGILAHDAMRALGLRSRRTS
jgi:hypothetical protein